MGMHKFGTPRWSQQGISGLVDDIRSHTDQNTRVIGDFTKIVNATEIPRKMHAFLSEDPNWQLYFEKLVADLGFSDELKDIWALLKQRTDVLKGSAPFRRSHLQTRFFETGDNFYLGMEFTREYDAWKQATIKALLAMAKAKAVAPADEAKAKKKLRALEGSLANSIDRLWYDATLEVIRHGDVYNPGGSRKIPRLYLIDALIDTRLSSLAVGDSFRLSADPTNRYELLVRPQDDSRCLVRDVEGHVTKMDVSTSVRRGGNLSRAPNGNSESKVSIATFPVAHYVNYRTARLSNVERGYVFAFLGDEQSTPHFMRYSGLTGACVNSMLFNQFIGDAIHGDEFIARVRRLSQETNWSNGEVVQRGTGANYGVDGFLRPGFPYAKGIDYLWSKAIEYKLSDQDPYLLLSHDWQVKFAAALIPRGMETNYAFLGALMAELQDAIFARFVRSVTEDTELLSLVQGPLSEQLQARAKALAPAGKGFKDLLRVPLGDKFWFDLLVELPEAARDRLNKLHVCVACALVSTVEQLIEFTTDKRARNERISSQLENQPLPVDSFIDNFAVEAQAFANGLTNVTAFAAAALALQFVTTAGTIVLASLSPLIALNTLANTSRYKNRNEDWRVNFADFKYLNLLKAVYACMSSSDREHTPTECDPYARVLLAQKEAFVRSVAYYDFPEPVGFVAVFNVLMGSMHRREAVAHFLNQLATHFLPDEYHVNSYLQEELVAIYATAEELLRVLDTDVDPRSEAAVQARIAFERVLCLETSLEASLQRGPILYGYQKQRSLKHGHVATICRYFYTLLWWHPCCERLPRSVAEAHAEASSPLKPIAVETRQLCAQLHALCKLTPLAALRRQTIDVESLYFATHESYVSSFIIGQNFATITVFVIFVISQISVLATGGAGTSSDMDTINGTHTSMSAEAGAAQWSVDLATVATGASATVQPVGALLASYHLWRKIAILWSTNWSSRSQMRKSQCPQHRRRLAHVSHVMLLVVFVNVLRLVACLGAGVSIVWNFANIIVYGSESADSPNRVPVLWLAVGSASLHLFSIVLRFLIEYSVMWKLGPELGKYVVSAFDDELSTLHDDLSTPQPTTVTDAVHKRTTWEYVTRAFLRVHRFDTAFGADRFGSIFNQIQTSAAQDLTGRSAAEKSCASGESVGPSESMAVEDEETGLGIAIGISPVDRAQPKGVTATESATRGRTANLGALRRARVANAANAHAGTHANEQSQVGARRRDLQAKLTAAVTQNAQTLRRNYSISKIPTPGPPTPRGSVRIRSVPPSPRGSESRLPVPINLKTPLHPSSGRESDDPVSMSPAKMSST